MITPRNHSGRTKQSFTSLYNEECAEVLEPYLNTRKSPSKHLFPNDRSRFRNVAWREARRITGIDITPKMLREWFCNEMGRIGVPDRYIDAFCGRVPKSILARHYTDYNPQRLKRIYDKANLKVLS